LSNHFRIAAFDMRGHGDSDKPLDPDAYADADRWGDDIKAMIEAAALERPTLVGWSFGGLVLGHYLRRHGADGIRGLALVCAVTKFAPELFGPKGMALGAGLSSSDLAVRAEAIVDTVHAITAKPLPPAVFNRTVAVNGMAPRALQLGYGRTDPAGLDAGFAQPKQLLAIYGSKDGITLPGMATRLAQVNPAVRLVEFKDSGHAPHYDETDRFNREVAAFAAA
jgi:non-heme chloroperoxidase